MEDIKVSIIIPVFNTSKYLKQCLDSVINQTLHEIEIICIDDGSTDNSLEILQEYQKQDNRIKILTQKHKKQGAARNYGMTIACGEYIGFVDSDDWCELDMFEKLYKRAKETNSDITMCAITTFNNNNSNEYSKEDTYTNLDIFPKEFFNRVFVPDETIDFLLNICVCPPNKIIKRNLIKSNNIKFDEHKYYEDGAFFYDTWLYAKRISLIKYFGYYYRMFSDTTTCFINDFHKLQNFQVLEYKKRILKKHKVYKKLKKDFISYKRNSILYWLHKITDKRAKFLYYIFMLFSMPSCYLEPLISFKREFWLLKQIKLNKNKRIVLWGASIFLENFISKYNINNKNIINIIDKNSNKHNTTIGNYFCCSPEKLKELNADMVIITIVNFSKSNRHSIKEFLNKKVQKEIEIKCI